MPQGISIVTCYQRSVEHSREHDKDHKVLQENCSPRLNDTYSRNDTASPNPIRLYLYLHLAHGLISTPRRPRAETADPQAEQQLLA